MKLSSIYLALLASSTLAFTLFVSLFLSACAASSSPKKVEPAPSPRVDIKAQQLYYDQGLQYYAKENYQAAQESFQKVVENGPNTSLGLKAQENLKKLKQILKTLENIQPK